MFEDITGSQFTEDNILQVCVEFFHKKYLKNDDLTHFEERFSESAIDKYYLGWAPPNDSLYVHLSNEHGFSDEEILQSGLFTENEYTNKPSCLWQGRFVYPYLNQDGVVVYAIARATGDKGGGAAGYDGHPSDFLAGKYAKLKHTADNCPFQEPIFGLNTISEDTDTLIITEGIADAIQADIHGFSVLSPVTTQFKEKHIPELVSILEAYNITTVYLIPDNETPSEDTISQYSDAAVGEGLKGALTFSYKFYQFVADETTDTYTLQVTTLPRNNAEKIDFDEYLQSHSKTDVTTLLQQPTHTKPAEKYEFYQIYKTEQDQLQHAESTYTEENTDKEFYNLSVTDLITMQPGERGLNPIEHVGDSENYFKVSNDGQVAHDFKSHQSYNATKFLAHKIGLRSRNSVEESLSNKEVFKVFEHAKQHNIISEDAKIPAKALEFVANYNFDFIPLESGQIPPDVYYATIDYLNRIKDYTIPDESPYMTEDYYTNQPNFIYSAESCYYSLDQSILTENEIEFTELTDSKVGWRPADHDFDVWYSTPVLYAILTEEYPLEKLNPYTVHTLSDKQYTDYCSEIVDLCYLYVDNIPLKIQRYIAQQTDTDIQDTYSTEQYKYLKTTFKNNM